MSFMVCCVALNKMCEVVKLPHHGDVIMFVCLFVIFYVLLCINKKYLQCVYLLYVLDI
jgi:hypothetical protein